jgi:hypothetical protein
MSSFPQIRPEHQKVTGAARAVAQALKDMQFDRADEGLALIVQLAVLRKGAEGGRDWKESVQVR